MAVYSVRGLAAATDAIANSGIGTLWNPSSADRLKVIEFGVTTTGPTGGGTSSRITFRRVSGRGTPGSTVTPDADNSWTGVAAPPSGALLDLSNYSVEPTILATSTILQGVNNAGITGSDGFQWVWAPNNANSPVILQPGVGLSAVCASAVGWPESEVYVVWEED